MNLVDSSAWLEYFADGKNAKVFAPVISETSTLIVSSINLFEVYKRVLSQRDEHSALQAVGIMQQATVIPVNASISLHAAQLSVDHKIPMADSIIYATALAYQAVVWTQDSDFEGLA